MTIFASKIDVSEVRLNDKGKPERVRYAYHGANTSEPKDEEEFGYSQKRTSLNEIAKRYKAALKEYKKDSTDLGVSNPTASRRAIVAIAPDAYPIMWSYSGGDCVYDECIVDGDRMLEVGECKYSLAWISLGIDSRRLRADMLIVPIHFLVQNLQG